MSIAYSLVSCLVIFLFLAVPFLIFMFLFAFFQRRRRQGKVYGLRKRD